MMGDLQNGESADSALVKQAVGGDAQAFGLLYDRYSLNIYRFLCGQLFDPYEAEDLTSEVFLRAWQSISSYRERGYPFSAYLYRIARNVVIDRHRKAKHWHIHSIDQINTLEDASEQPGEVQSKNQLQSLQDGLQKLPEAYRSVLVLRFIVGASTEEAAKAMNRSEGAIRVLQHRALKSMRRYLSGEDF
jgi:RNA polymerase sigma-70 factor (ECF subfamily)